MTLKTTLKKQFSEGLISNKNVFKTTYRTVTLELHFNVKFGDKT